MGVVTRGRLRSSTRIDGLCRLPGGWNSGSESRVFQWLASDESRYLLRLRLFRRMPAEHRTVGHAVSGAVPAQNRSIRPGESGFHDLELAGIDNIVIPAGQKSGNLSLRFLDALFNRRIIGECVSDLVMQRHLSEEIDSRQSFGEARVRLGLFAVQFFQSFEKCLRIVSRGIHIFESE